MSAGCQRTLAVFFRIRAAADTQPDACESRILTDLPDQKQPAIERHVEIGDQQIGYRLAFSMARLQHFPRLLRLGKGDEIRLQHVLAAHVVEIEKIILAVYPAEYISVITGDGSKVVPMLMQSFRFDHIFYTGSMAVGRMIYQQAAASLIPVTLELGGKSPAIVESDANLTIAAKRIALGKFNNGKSCTLCAGSQQKSTGPGDRSPGPDAEPVRLTRGEGGSRLSDDVRHHDGRHHASCRRRANSRRRANCCGRGSRRRGKNRDASGDVRRHR